MNLPLDFQSIIMALQNFWAKQGCLIWQPYYSQVGAGTMNPATFLRVLGPEPWKVAYVEPSIRPDDGRYGENPNRLQMHYQFQVILKPDPGNPQDLYLKSLEALGIDQRQHDIRFVEDNWKQPALGAWGLGWEVWLDGQEITQFTYFQQAGGISLDPVSVELTYGLERIAIALQGVDSFLDIRWNPGFTDGEINLSAEQEHSKYYFEIADVESLRKMFELYSKEAATCLDKELVLPAYDYLLKCSHTFNVLDTRGAVGVTERQTYFGRMRDLARGVSEAYLEQRRAVGFPWLQKERTPDLNPIKPVQEPKKITLSRDEQADQPAPFLLEIGTEELPVGDLLSGLGQLEEALPTFFRKVRLTHGEIKVLGTPRRLVVYVEQLAPAQDDQVQIIKGPPADRAFDDNGKPTTAAEGFAKTKGIDLNNLEIREMDGGRYAVAIFQELGRRTTDVLRETLPDLIASLQFDQSMRWNSTNVTFSRPIRWLLALFGNEFIPCEYAGVRAGEHTYGLRFHDPEKLPIKSIPDYFSLIRAQGILLDPDERHEDIRSQVESLASQLNGRISNDTGFLDEVTNLVEAPAALLGSFAESHLDLPHEVLISVMKKHQRYFPVFREDASGSEALLPNFVLIRNGDGRGDELVVAGNEHVLRARFADAEFFVREDLKHTLGYYLPRLESLTFQASLGSMLEKTNRIQALAADLATMIGTTAEEAQIIHRASALCKADLATQMVVEMTSLQGIMGRYYALKSGEPLAVAEAIFEHYLPRHSGDLIPGSLPGLVVGLADRLDSLCGLFTAGNAPTGTRDPFGLRRSALGLVQNLIAWEIDLDLLAALEAAAKYIPVEKSPELLESVFLFIVDRLRHYLMSKGFRYDVVDAVVAAQGRQPVGTMRAVQSIGSWVEHKDWKEILPAFARCVRITRDFSERFIVDEHKFLEAAETSLYEGICNSESRKRTPGSADDFLNAFIPLIPLINRFFDEVLVMIDDEELRRNRLALLQRIVALADKTADMSYLEGF